MSMANDEVTGLCSAVWNEGHLPRVCVLSPDGYIEGEFSLTHQLLYALRRLIRPSLQPHRLASNVVQCIALLTASAFLQCTRSMQLCSWTTPSPGQNGPHSVLKLVLDYYTYV